MMSHSSVNNKATSDVPSTLASNNNLNNSNNTEIPIPETIKTRKKFRKKKYIANNKYKKYRKHDIKNFAKKKYIAKNKYIFFSYF